MPSPKDKFAAEFFEFNFFQAVRILEKLHPKRVPIGQDGPPADEVARFRSHLSMSFPPSQIIAIDSPNEERPNPLLTVTFFGLYGPSGVLPTHYTQLLLELNRDVRGDERYSLRDWFDLFDHRFISLFYRGWEKYRFHLAYDRGEPFGDTPDTFTLAIRSLMGIGSPSMSNRLVVRGEHDLSDADPFAFPDDPRSAVRKQDAALARIDDLALMYYAGFFAQRPRNVTNLRTLLADYFRLPVEVEQFRGQWLLLSEDCQTQLGTLGTLGMDAIAGERVWDVQSQFRVRIGPLSFQQFEELLPDREPQSARKTFFLVAQLARVFVGDEFDFDIQLVLAAPEVPETVLNEPLGAGPRLGWTIWLISDTPGQHADDAVFDTEWVTTL